MLTCVFCFCLCLVCFESSVRSLWLKLQSRLKSLCRTANSAKAPSSPVHIGTGPARLQVGWLSCLVFRSLWLKLPSRLKSLCRTVNGAKAPSSLVHTGTGPARLQVGWLSCLVFAFFFLSSVVWTHWSTFSL